MSNNRFEILLSCQIEHIFERKKIVLRLVSKRKQDLKKIIIINIIVNELNLAFEVGKGVVVDHTTGPLPRFFNNDNNQTTG